MPSDTYLIVTIEKKNIKFGTSKNGANYANGSIEVEVENQFGTNAIKIDVMQMELKKDGEVNKAYKALQTINEECKSIEESGKEKIVIKGIDDKENKTENIVVKGDVGSKRRRKQLLLRW